MEIKQAINKIWLFFYFFIIGFLSSIILLVISVQYLSTTLFVLSGISFMLALISIIQFITGWGN